MIGQPVLSGDSCPGSVPGVWPRRLEPEAHLSDCFELEAGPVEGRARAVEPRGELATQAQNDTARHRSGTGQEQGHGNQPCTHGTVYVWHVHVHVYCIRTYLRSTTQMRTPEDLLTAVVSFLLGDVRCLLHSTPGRIYVVGTALITYYVVVLDGMARWAHLPKSRSYELVQSFVGDLSRLSSRRGST